MSLIDSCGTRGRAIASCAQGFTRFTPAAPPIAEVLGRAFSDDAAADTSRHRAGLHEATVAFASRLRAEGVPPERAIIALKSAIMQHGGLNRPPSLVDEADDASAAARAATYKCMLDWFLDAYYAE